MSDTAGIEPMSEGQRGRLRRKISEIHAKLGGGTEQAQMPIAGMWRRVFAYMIDRIPIWGAAVTAVMAVVISKVMNLIEASAVVVATTPSVEEVSRLVDQVMTDSFGLITVVFLVSFAVTSFITTVIPHAVWGRTLGKAAMGLGVVSRESFEKAKTAGKVGGVGWGRALRRWLVPAIEPLAGLATSLIILTVGYAWAWTNKERHTVHDLVAGTTVINSRSLKTGKGL